MDASCLAYCKTDQKLIYFKAEPFEEDDHMAQKKEELPMNVDVDLQNGGTITYANEVLAIIAGVAANEIDGIAGMSVSGGLSDIIGKNRNVTKGVKVEIGGEEASVDLYVIVEYGQPIQKVSHDVQENVRKAVESMTGLHVARVDVHVQGLSFEKEKKAAQSSLEASRNLALAEPEKKAEPAKEPAPVREEAPAQEDKPVQEAAPAEDESVKAPDGDEKPAEEPAPAEEAAPETDKKAKTKIRRKKI